ncbi:MAG: hypothetical protein E7380_04530 [Clostridiales bacterium]|nr:hypothetical protein [Clostridiales bacterium]
MLKSFIGKLISFALAGVLIFAVAGCGDEEEEKKDNTVNGVVIDDKNGEVVSSAQARAFFAEMETEKEEITAETVMKYTYWMKMSTSLTSGETYSMTAGSRYSREADYLYTWTQMVNQPVYEYNQDGSVNSRIGTQSSSSGIYAYITDDGNAIEAIHGHISGTINGQFSSSSSAQWSYLNEEGETAEEAFEDNLFSGLLDIMATLLSYENQMATAIEGITVSDIQIPGCAIQSKGKGHLYVTMDMGIGMSYLIEYTDYHLSYMKLTIDSSLGDPEIISMTTEMYFKMGECEVTYPDLSTYEYNEDAITPDIDLDVDLG